MIWLGVIVWLALGTVGGIWLMVQTFDFEVDDLLGVPIFAMLGPLILALAALYWFIPEAEQGRKVLIKQRTRRRR